VSRVGSDLKNYRATKKTKNINRPKDRELEGTREEVSSKKVIISQSISLSVVFDDIDLN
jgi:hypothetical protein